jgi:hypothetical protein
MRPAHPLSHLVSSCSAVPAVGPTRSSLKVATAPRSRASATPTVHLEPALDLGELPKPVDQDVQPQQSRKRKAPSDFAAASREVLELGTSGMLGRDRREAEKQRLARIGANPSKNIKTPFKMLNGMRRASEARDTKQRELMRNMGLEVAGPAKKERRSEHSDGGTTTLKASIGRYSGATGMLTLSKKDIHAAKKSARHSSGKDLKRLYKGKIHKGNRPQGRPSNHN